MASSREAIGDLDLHLFGEGAHRRLWELLGPNVGEDGDGVRFAVWAPNAAAVSVVGDWNGWSGEALEMIEVEVPSPAGSSADGPETTTWRTGIWVVEARGAEPGHCYKYEVVTPSGRILRKADPMARQTEAPPSDASVVPAPSAHLWSDGDWMSERAGVLAGTAPMRIYEVHLGSWKRGVASWDDLADQLGAHVERLGFTHVELMPIAEHPYGGSWGYQVSGYYAPTARFGDPDGLRRFVDSLHSRGIGVIVDWVPAHFPRDAWSLGRFDGTPLYEHPDPRRGEHPDWGTYVFDFGRPEVRNFLVANALYWLDEFHVDGLRVDAVASMLYLDYSRDDGAWAPNQHGGREHLEAIELLQTVNNVVDEEFPDALIIAEESTSWPGVTHPVEEGGLGFDLKWNMGWMNDTLGYMKLDPVHRRYHHNELTFAQVYAYTERFVLPLSHDEVVHGKASLLGKMSGDDWQRFANLRCLLAWQWCMPGAPLVFMGTELAPWQEWNDASELPWHLLDHASHRGVFELVQTMNNRCDQHPALWQRDTDPGGFQWIDADDADRSMFSFVRWAEDGASAVVCLSNFTPVPRPGYVVPLPWGGEWSVILDTDSPEFWGSGHRGFDRGLSIGDDEGHEGIDVVVGVDGDDGSTATVDVGPLSVVWLAASAPPAVSDG